MAINGFFLTGRHRVVFVVVHHPDEWRDVQRHIHVVFDNLIDAKQCERAPWESNRICYAALQHIARFRRRGLHVGTAK